jgi:hypothetical protein
VVAVGIIYPVALSRLFHVNSRKTVETQSFAS